MNFFEIKAYAHPADEVYEGQPAKIGEVEVNPNIYPHTHTRDNIIGMITMVLPLLIVLAVLYFVMIRPQRKKEKEDKKAVQAMTTGDVVITIGGISGRVTEIQNRFVFLAIGTDDGEYTEPVIKVLREAVQSVEKKDAQYAPVIKENKE